MNLINNNNNIEHKITEIKKNKKTNKYSTKIKKGNIYNDKQANEENNIEYMVTTTEFVTCFYGKKKRIVHLSLRF